MKLRSFVAAAAALALTTAPAIAQSASADLGRTVALAKSESSIGGEPQITFLALLAASALAIYFVTDNDDKPASP